VPSSNIYQVTWNKLVTWFIPQALRKTKLLCFVQALVAPVNDLHTRFLYYRQTTIYSLGISPQVCYLQKALNDRYDLVLRRIIIVDGVEYDALPLFRKVENKPVRLYRRSESIPLVLYTKSETALFSVDFIVKVPVDISFDQTEMTAFVTSYKLASKVFKIQTV
jgi:hypothetical protein